MGARLAAWARRAGLALVLAGLGAPAPLAAQTVQAARPAVVVQVAGATFYLNVGTDDGLRTGDTLAVRRKVDAPTLGAVVVVGATARRAVLSFAGAAFPVTRGDTLYYVPRAGEGALIAPTVAVVEATRPRAPPAVARRARVDGAVGFEMWGSHTETVGLGADPVRTTRDIGMPAVRFNTFVTGDRSRLRVNLRAQQRTGGDAFWDRRTRIRIYEARYDLRTGPARLTVGRFFSDFDHQSAFWDGASVRFGDERGVSAGVAAGFEPERGNEEVSFRLPKAAAFVGTRHSRGQVDLTTDLAVTQTLPSDQALRRAGADFAMRLRVGRFSFSGDVEATPPTPMGRWGLARVLVRASVPAGKRGYVYASAVSDRLTPLDTTFLAPFTRRERATAGVSLSTSGGTYLDLNGSVNDPGGELTGYAAGATVSVPRVLGAGIASLHASWFDDGQGTGLLASPGLEYRVGSARVRGGYQFYRVEQRATTLMTHGIDLRAWQPFGPRMSGVLQVTERFGGNLTSTTIFTSFEVRF